MTDPVVRRRSVTTPRDSLDRWRSVGPYLTPVVHRSVRVTGDRAAAHIAEPGTGELVPIRRSAPVFRHASPHPTRIRPPPVERSVAPARHTKPSIWAWCGEVRPVEVAAP